MRLRVLIALALALVGSSLVSATASAAAARPGDRQVRRIIRDCVRDDDLDRAYGVKALRRALRRLPDDVRNYTNCERAIRRQLRKRDRQVRRLFRDCSRDHDLDRRYPRAVLREGLRRIRVTGRHRDCRKPIRRALRNPPRAR
jgi:hypothetical protein